MLNILSRYSKVFERHKIKSSGGIRIIIVRTCIGVPIIYGIRVSSHQQTILCVKANTFMFYKCSILVNLFVRVVKIKKKEHLN